MLAIRMKDQRLDWDSENLRFTNNEKANELLKIQVQGRVDALTSNVPTPNLQGDGGGRTFAPSADAPRPKPKAQSPKPKPRALSLPVLRPGSSPRRACDARG